MPEDIEDGFEDDLEEEKEELDEEDNAQEGNDIFHATEEQQKDIEMML